MFKGRGARDRPEDRRPRHRRDLHRPHRDPRGALTTAVAPSARGSSAGGARATGLSLPGRHHAQQAAAQAGLGTRQARRPGPCCELRDIRRASGRWRRKVNGIGPKAMRSWPARPARGGDIAAADPNPGAATPGANYGRWLHDIRARPRPARGGDAQRAGLDQPRDHPERDRTPCATAPRSAIFTELCVELRRRPTRKGYADARPSASLRFRRFQVGHARPPCPRRTLMDAGAIRRCWRMPPD